MIPVDREHRLKALAEKSSYIENVLRHSLIAQLSSVVWSRDPFLALQVFNSEVDDSGFDIVLSLGTQIRYVQLKQAHDEKIPTHCSVRLSFADVPGSCVVLMSYTIMELHLTKFRFFGGAPGQPMERIDALRATKAPGRRNAAGERKTRTNYRDIPVRNFKGPYSAPELLDALFPQPHTS